MITKEEVKHIAKLARLGLGDEPKDSSLPVAKARVTEKEIGKYQKELSSILDYIEKLKEVDVSKIEPTSHSIRVENVLRNDEIRKHAPYRTEGSGAGLMELAPETKQGFLKVKSIFK